MISKKLSHISPSVTVGISTKVNEMKSNGIDVIGLSIGEPDFGVPEKALAYGIKSLEENKTKYSLVPGMKELRAEICYKLKVENNIEYTPDDIICSSGAKNSLTNIFLTLLDPSDEVLLPLPYWVSYSEAVKLLGGIPVTIHTSKENNFKLTDQDLKAAITNKSKILVITNPSNPTGAVYTKKELEEIVDICVENNIYIIADEIYEKICFEKSFTSIASISEKAKDITITVNGFSKCAAMTGLRVGYTASNPELAKAMKAVQSHLIHHPSLTAQYVALGALRECVPDMEMMTETYKKRCKLVCSRLDQMPNISYIKPGGAFYLFIDFSLYKEKIHYNDSFSIAFCEKLLEDALVALVPGAAFGLDDFCRLSYACSEEDLIKALDRIEIFLKSL